MAGTCDIVLIGMGFSASSLPVKSISSVTAELSNDTAITPLLALGGARSSGLTFGAIGARSWTFAWLISQLISSSMWRMVTASKSDLS